MGWKLSRFRVGDLVEVRSKAEILATLDAIDPRPYAELAPGLRLSWCNGLAGQTMLWTEAHRYSRDPVHLDRAVWAARAMISNGRVARGNLCCGLGGCAFALLGLARIAPRQGFEAIALTYGVRAMARMASPWPNGLLRGWAGQICLAAELLDGEAAGFPLL
jgi:hypothetical protein